MIEAESEFRRLGTLRKGLPGLMDHAETRSRYLAAGAKISTDALLADGASRDVATLQATLTSNGLEIRSQLDESTGGESPALPADVEFEVNPDDHGGYGQAFHKRSNCYSKINHLMATIKICYWKYRIDENSNAYDYWLYGNEAVALRKRLRFEGDPYFKWVKVTQQLGAHKRANFHSFKETDALVRYWPRGETQHNCTTISTSVGVSANVKGVAVNSGVTFPIKLCETVYGNAFGFSAFGQANWSRPDSSIWSRPRSRDVAAVTILKLDQRPYENWQPFYSDRTSARACHGEANCRNI